MLERAVALAGFEQVYYQAARRGIDQSERDMKVNRVSYIRFVYPFLFDAEQFRIRRECVDSFECEDGIHLWEKQPFPERDLLPHVARYLNPSAGSVTTVRLWHIAPEMLRSPKGLAGGAVNPGADWSLVHRGKNTPFVIEDVQLSLFQSGVGFLIFRIRPNVVEVADWLDFLHDFRFLRREGVTVEAQRRTGFDTNSQQPTVAPYFPALAGDIPDDRKDSQRFFQDVVEGLLRTGESADCESPWWSEVFISQQAIPYAVLFAEGVPQSDVEQQTLIYKLHNFFHSGQGQHPAPEELLPKQPFLLPYAERQWFLFSLDGSSFLACDPPDTEFFRITLPDHLDSQYLLLFLLVLQQRFALMHLTDQVTKHWLADERADNKDVNVQQREQVFRIIRDGLLSFTARGYFSQAMQRWHHHRCYVRWQETFQVERLFQEVSDEVREMHSYLQMQKAERLETLAEEEQERSARMKATIDYLAAFLLLPAFVLSFLSTVGKQSWWSALIGVAVGLAAGGVLLWFLRRTPAGD